MNRTNSKFRTISLLLVLVACSSLPFINQAFHIDDRLYLEVAEQALDNPLFPYDAPMLFEGIRVPDGASHSHLPLTAYYMALIKIITGSAEEWIFHLFFIPFPLIAVFSFHGLAGRYVKSPLTATALLVLSPVFLTLSHNLMTDIPMLSLWLLASNRYFRLINGEGKGIDWGIMAAALLGASLLSLLTAGLILLFLVGLPAFHYLNTGKSKDREEYRGGFFHKMRIPHLRVWILLLSVPFLLWTAWYARAWVHYDRFVLANTLLHMNKRETLDLALLGTKLLSFILNTGALFVFPLLAWALLRKREGLRIGSILAAVALVTPFIFFPGWELIHKLFFSLFFSSGVILLAVMIKELQKPSFSNLFLFSWFFGILLACLLLFYSGSARYVLLALPPAILIITARLEARFPRGNLPVKVIMVILALSAFYSVPISWTDYSFAGTYRNAARKLCAEYQEKGRTVWFTGEWGFRYYMTDYGAQILARNEPLAEKGDIIIKPFIASPWVTLYDGDEYTSLLEQIPARIKSPLRILDFSSEAGFYSTGWGLLPFSWTSGEHWEWFNVFEVTQEYTGPVPEDEKHW